MDEEFLFKALRNRYVNLKKERDAAILKIKEDYDVRLKGLKRELEVMAEELNIQLKNEVSDPSSFQPVENNQPSDEEIQNDDLEEPEEFPENPMEDANKKEPVLVEGTFSCEYSPSESGLCVFDESQNPDFGDMTQCVYWSKCQVKREQAEKEFMEKQKQERQQRKGGVGSFRPIRPRKD